MSVIHRSIKAILYPNPLKNAKGKFLARTKKHITYTTRDLCESVQRKNREVNVDLAEYYAKMLFAEMAELIADGYKIDTGYFSGQAFIKGSFNSKGDRFDPRCHRVEAIFSTGHLMRKQMENVIAEIEHVNGLKFGITTVINASTKTPTNLLYANQVLIVAGSKIKITGTDPSVGLYLTHTVTHTEHHIPLSQLIDNKNTTLMFQVPDIPAGDYELSLHTQYAGKGTPLNQPRSCCYINLLTVEQRI